MSPVCVLQFDPHTSIKGLASAFLLSRGGSPEICHIPHKHKYHKEAAGSLPWQPLTGGVEQRGQRRGFIYWPWGCPEVVNQRAPTETFYTLKSPRAAFWIGSQTEAVGFLQAFRSATAANDFTRGGRCIPDVDFTLLQWQEAYAQHPSFALWCNCADKCMDSFTRPLSQTHGDDIEVGLQKVMANG